MATYRRMTTMIVAAALLGVFCGVALAVEVAPGVQVHGYMLNRFYTASGTSAEFRMERVSISTIAALANDSKAYFEMYYQPGLSSLSSTAGSIYIESAYFDTPVGEGRLRIGKGRRVTFGITPEWSKRRTTNYGIVSEAFTQSRIQGLQYSLQKDALDLGISLHQGFRLGSRVLGEIAGDPRAVHEVKHLCFKEETGNLMGRKMEIAARLGGKWEGGLKAGVSYSTGRLEDVDLANMTSIVAASTLNTAGGLGTSLVPTTATNKKRNVWGLDFTYEHPSGFLAQGEYYDASVSALDYKAWNALLGYKNPQGWMFFARYSKQDMPASRLSANEFSWDNKQVSLSIVQPLRKGLWLQWEYEINSEKPPVGIDTKKNNLFFVELFTGF